MPSDAPSARDASFIADPAPARRGGTADMIAAVIGDIVSAMPVTSNNIDASTCGQPVCVVSNRNNNRPTVTGPSPNATTPFAPYRALRGGVTGAPLTSTGPPGRDRSAPPA